MPTSKKLRQLGPMCKHAPRLTCVVCGFPVKHNRHLCCSLACTRIRNEQIRRAPNEHYEVATGVYSIKLTLGRFALIDAGDYGKISNIRWHTHRIRKSDTLCYVQGTLKGTTHPFAMHTWLMKPPAGLMVDHINGNGLDNRRCNMRIVTNRENLQNLHVNKSSKYPGVCFLSRENKWRASIRVSGHGITLGSFVNEEDAAESYRKACAAIDSGTFVVEKKKLGRPRGRIQHSDILCGIQ